MYQHLIILFTSISNLPNISFTLKRPTLPLPLKAKNKRCLYSRTSTEFTLVMSFTLTTRLAIGLSHDSTSFVQKRKSTLVNSEPLGSWYTTLVHPVKG